MAYKRTKITVVGAGEIGSAILYTLMLKTLQASWLS